MKRIGDAASFQISLEFLVPQTYYRITLAKNDGQTKLTESVFVCY